VHDGIVLKQIKRNDASSILRYFGFSGDSIDNIIGNAYNAVKWEEVNYLKNHDPIMYQNMLSDYYNNKKKYKKWTLPSSWFGEDNIKLYVDVPMHLLFLGITKAVMSKATKWLTLNRQFTTFQSLAHNVLEPIERMNISWCKILKYPSTDKFGGWVSENYLAMARACNWFYSILTFLPRVEEYEDPSHDLPISEWSGNQLKGWLDSRGIKCNGNVKQLRETVENYKFSDEEPEIKCNDQVKYTDITNLFATMNNMITYMMSDKIVKSDIEKLEVFIRMFLICYDIVDQGINDESDPSYMRQYNFLCLLNIPSTMREYGCMRNMWEGGIVGEGFLRGMKKELKQGMIGKWQIWTLKNILEKDLYCNLIGNDDVPICVKDRKLFEKECVIHRNEDQAGKAYASGEPISGMIINGITDNVYMIYKKKNQLWFMGIEIETHESVFHCNCDYYRINLMKVNEGDNNDINNLVNKNDEIIGVMLLPRLFENNYEEKNHNSSYCIIRSDWM
jgi:hypothetical protein